jgi:hypothetical protein
VFLVLFPPHFWGRLVRAGCCCCCAPFDMESNFLFKNIQKDMVGPRGVATDRNFFVSWCSMASLSLSLCARLVYLFVKGPQAHFSCNLNKRESILHCVFLI